MNFGNVIYFVTQATKENSVGDIIPDPDAEPLKRKVYADKRSVRQSEFYQAAATGFQPTVVFVVRLSAYQEEKIIEYKDKSYTVIRTYQKDSDFLEIVCQGLVNNG